nr:hypothetical protein [uncultured bacterium]
MKRTSLLFLLTFSLFTIQPNSVEAQFGIGDAGGNGQQGNQGVGNESGGNRGAGNDARGGGSIADFDSLMELIETTVSPETWEALGGPSNMFPYPQGVYVDASGTLKEIEWPADSDSTNKLKSILVRPPAAGTSEFGDWKEPSPMRYVSLQRLLNENNFSQTETAESIDCLAGLSQVRYVFLDQDDIILAGPVGGIESHQGWYRDQTSGRTALRTDFFITCLASALAKEPFGCTIDPTREGLQHAAHIAAMVKSNNIPISAAPEEMVVALGMQQIEVFGTAGDTPIGYVMVEADRHMKQLALGVHPMPPGAKNYLDIIEQAIDQGPPQDLLLRLWFTAKPRAVRAGSDGAAFEIAGTPIRLSGQNERAVANGTRGHVTKDPRTKVFVDEFNEHWSDIRSEYPIYSALESIYHAASIAELVGRTATSPQQQELLTSLAAVDTTSRFIMPTPRQVESIAVLHTFRSKRQRHHILIASGGVAVTPQQTLPSSFIGYPSLDKHSLSETEPTASKRWWWNR